LTTLDGAAAVLAHISIRSPYRVGKYGVDVRALENTGVPALLEAAASCELIIVDEIGKMELFSEKFQAAINAIIHGGKPVLATIMLASNPFADSIKSLPNVRLLEVTAENRANVLLEAQRWLKELLEKK
jgi:nucleoside-triphosphatase